MQITMAKSSSYVGGRAKIDAVDFILEFDLTPTEIAPGGGFHLLYRYIAEGDYYLLGFYPDGEWEIGFQDDQRFNRLAGGQTDQIVMGQTTKVIVIVSGDKMAVLLNGQPLGYAQGPSKRGEDNTFEVNGPNGDTSVEIDNIIFWDLQNLYSKTK